MHLGFLRNNASRIGVRSLSIGMESYWATAEDDWLGSFAAMGHPTNAFDDDADRYAENKYWADGLPDLEATEESEQGA